MSEDQATTPGGAPKKRPTTRVGRQVEAERRQTQQLGERAAAASRKAADDAATLAAAAIEAARAAAAAADKVNRRLPNPAPVKMIVGAPPPVRGVPRKFTPELQRTYFDALARGLTRSDACKLAGVTRQTTKNYRDKDPAFSEAEAEAELQACELIEEALFDAAKQGNVEAIKLWLFNRAPERWKPAQKMQLELTGQVDMVHDSAQRLEQIASLEATLLARAALKAGELPILELEAIEP